MSRSRRPNLPGAFFHITARLQRGEPLFTPELRTRTVGLLNEEVSRSEARLLAYCVMPNHLHVVLQQGPEPLHTFMQPVLRRVALSVQRLHAMSGHVFGQPFAAFFCGDPEYLRNAIAYTHLNPVRAKICSTCADYHWSSHSCYANPEGAVAEIASELGLPLFAAQRGTRADHSRDYVRYVDWRVRADELDRLAELGQPLPSRRRQPCTLAGDCFWRDRLRLAKWPADELSCSPRTSLPERRPDLRDVALAVLQDADVDVEMLELVRSRFGGARMAEIRRAVVCRAAAYRYRGVDIARFLRISRTAVSRIMRGARTARRGLS